MRGEQTISYDQLTPERIRNCQLIVNTTPLGMHPKVEKCPDIPYEALGTSHFLL